MNPAAPLAEAITVLSAGSLRDALPALVQASGLPATLQLGPAGLLRERIEQGAVCDLFISASPGHVARLAEQRPLLARATVARNRLGLTLLAKPEYSGRSALDLLLDERLRIGTSTPGADPGGDYAWALFDRIEQLHPGQGARLKARALPLVGGRHSPPVPAGQIAAAWLLLQNKADLVVGYAHNASRLRQDPRLLVLPLPPALHISAEYVAAQLSPQAQGLMRFLCSPAARAIFHAHGFEPSDAAAGADADPAQTL